MDYKYVIQVEQKYEVSDNSSSSVYIAIVSETLFLENFVSLGI